MRDFLQAMARSSAGRAAAARAREPEAALRRRALAAPPAPALRLHPSGFDLVAEIKHRSPSAGRLAPAGAEDRIEARALACARGGAAAVSVLTEPDAFDGALEHLARAARVLPVPALRKDFLVDPYQVLEARAAGAGGVLLVLRIVDDAQAHALLDAAGETGMFVLLETFDAADLDRAGALLAARARTGAGPAPDLLLGVNSRDLRDLSSDRERHARLAGRIPAGPPRVAESGIADADAVRRAVRHGYRLALVGEALMRAADPGAETARLLEAGRAEAAAVAAAPRLGVKICGVRDTDTLAAAAAAGADAVGFVFAPSPRRLTPAAAERLADRAPAALERVGVFADELPPFAAGLLRDGVIHAVQADAAALDRLGDDVPAARRLPVFHDGDGAEAAVTALLARGPLPSRLLFEGRASGRGLSPDWDRAARLAARVRLVLAGGLSPDNVAAAVRRVRPAMVDVSSGVESAPGVKDPARIRAFVAAARAAHATPAEAGEERS